MDEDITENQRGEEEDESVPANEEQRAALQTPGSGQDEEQAETGQGILDHAEHSDAPGPFGTS